MKKGKAMPKYPAAAMFISVAFLALISPASFGLIRSASYESRSPADPTAVPGTALNHNVATPKPGYEFINRTNSVDVVRVRTNQIMGTYVCPCTRADRTGTCELVFNPQKLTCKGGSCTGASCLLTAKPRLMDQ
jgi:hypothetical protein